MFTSREVEYSKDIKEYMHIMIFYQYGYRKFPQISYFLAWMEEEIYSKCRWVGIF